MNEFVLIITLLAYMTVGALAVLDLANEMKTMKRGSKNVEIEK